MPIFGRPGLSLDVGTEPGTVAAGDDVRFSVHASQFGMSPDATAADNDAGMVAALAAIPASGGELLFGPGNYQFFSPVSAGGRRSLILRGGGTPTGGAAGGTTLTYTAPGSASFLNFQNAVGIVLEHLQILYTSPAFTGRLVDFRNLTTSDAVYCWIRDCHLGGNPSSLTGASALVDFDKATRSGLERCALKGATIGVRGRSAAGTYSNAITISDCSFDGQAVAHIWNPGEAWRISNNTFEPIADGTARALGHDAGVTAKGLLVTGNWSGDSTGGVVYTVAGKGIVIEGNYIGATNGVGIETTEVATALSIRGNVFEGCATAFKTIQPGGSASAIGWFIGPNEYVSVAARLSGNFASGTVYHDGQAQSATAGHTLYGIRMNGDVILVDGNHLQVATTTGTKIGTAAAQKLGFWGATPIVRPTTATVAAAFTANAGTTVNDASTFGGYTIGQVVAALKAAGLLT